MSLSTSAKHIFTRAILGSAGLLLMFSEVNAQNAFTSVQAFGDSYADTGNLFKILGVLNPPTYPTGRFSGGTNYVDTTSQLLGIPQTSYAIGGATAGSTNVAGPGLPGFAQEWQAFVGAGNRIAPTDIVELNIGGNEAREYWLSGGSAAGVAAASSVSAAQAMAGINALVGAGTRTLVFSVGDVGQLPEAAGNPAGAVGSAYSQNYNALMQAALANVARAGVRVEWIDITQIANLVAANPARYGIANVGACPLACIGNPSLQDKYLFYFDGIHLTSHGFTIMGEYIVNRLNAPLTFAPQGDLALTSAMGLASTLFGKLDMFREISVATASPMNSYARIGKAPFAGGPAPTINPWSFYMQANGGVSNRAATVSSTGFNLESVGGTIGTEYRINGSAFVGAAFDYSNPKARLLNNAGTSDVDSYQLGIYGGWSSRNFFAQGLATIGHQNYANTRPGVVDTLSSRPEGSTVVAAGKIGYLFNFGAGQVGPIGSLTYARAKVNSYAEFGDPILTLNVGSQVAEVLVGSVGAQLRAAVTVDNRVIQPYINLTLEDDLLGNGRVIQYGATSAPLIVNDWMIPSGSRRLYGRAAGGVVAPLGQNVALTANLSRTLGRQGGDDFYGAGGFKLSF
jgi:phospholipase/lecithinase/hemolysin/uncharacterized protein YhjY with autotransporter beta-barrel domain